MRARALFLKFLHPFLRLESLSSSSRRMVRLLLSQSWGCFYSFFFFLLVLYFYPLIYLCVCVSVCVYAPLTLLLLNWCRRRRLKVCGGRRGTPRKKPPNDDDVAGKKCTTLAVVTVVLYTVIYSYVYCKFIVCSLYSMWQQLSLSLSLSHTIDVVPHKCTWLRWYTVFFLLLFASLIALSRMKLANETPPTIIILRLMCAFFLSFELN